MKTEIEHKDAWFANDLHSKKHSNSYSPTANWESLGTQIHQLPVLGFETDVPSDIVKG